MKKVKPLLIIAVILAALLLVESQTKIIRRFLDNTIYDSYNHYLPCAALPSTARVVQVVAAHPEAIDLILAVDPGNVVIDIGTTACPEKADLLFSYPSHADRLVIEAMLTNHTFHSIPVRLRNW